MSQRHKPLPEQSRASDRGFTSNARSPTKAPEHFFSISNMIGDVKCEPDIEGDMMQQDKEAGPAFQLPSQMPRELQSWAWDKYASCLQQDTLDIPLPAFIVRLLLPHTVSDIERITHFLLIVCVEQLNDALALVTQ